MASRKEPPGSEDASVGYIPPSHQFDWTGVEGDTLVAAACSAVRSGYAFRVNAVGYGIALRVALSTLDGQAAGFTVLDAGELNQLLASIGRATDWIERRLERPERRLKRR